MIGQLFLHNKTIVKYSVFQMFSYYRTGFTPIFKCSSLVTQTKKHRKRLFSVLFSFIFNGIAYFFAKSALFQKLTTTFQTTATRTFDHYRPETTSKTAIFRRGQTNLKFKGLRSNFATSVALFLCFRHSNFSKFKRSKRFSTCPTAFLFPLVHLSRLR